MNSFNHSDGLQSTDETLVGMLAIDDEGALKQIFNRYNRKLLGLAAGVLSDDAMAKDIVQDVFIDLWNRRHTSQIQNLSNYLVRAIKFQVLKQLRNGKLRDRHVKLAEDIRFANHTEESLNCQELETLLSNAVDQLPPRCRHVFTLSRFENLSHKEIACRLGISAKTVEVQITKALVILRQRIDRVMFLAVCFLLG